MLLFLWWAVCTPTKKRENAAIHSRQEGYQSLGWIQTHFTPSLIDISSSSPLLSSSVFAVHHLPLPPEPAAMEELYQAVPPCLWHTHSVTGIMNSSEENPADSRKTRYWDCCLWLFSWFRRYLPILCECLLVHYADSDSLGATHIHTAHIWHTYLPLLSLSNTSKCFASILLCRQAHARGAEWRVVSLWLSFCTKLI